MDFLRSLRQFVYFVRGCEFYDGDHGLGTEWRTVERDFVGNCDAAEGIRTPDPAGDGEGNQSCVRDLGSGANGVERKDQAGERCGCEPEPDQLLDRQRRYILLPHGRLDDLRADTGG